MPAIGVGITPNVLKTTIAVWDKKMHFLAYEKFPVMGFLKAKGKVKNQDGGGEVRWVVRRNDHTLDTHIDARDTPFERVTDVENAVVPLGGIETRDGYTYLEKVQNKGEPAKIKYFAQKLENMMEDALQQFGSKVYVDGLGATAGAMELHGMETFMGIGAQTDTDELATNPNDTYAGISTGYTSLDSSASSGQINYGLWSPTIVNTARTVSGSEQAWSSFGDRYLRSLIHNCCKGDASKYNLDLITLRKASFIEVLNILEDKQRVMLQPPPHGSGAKVAAHGHEPHKYLYYDGVPVTWDFAIGGSDSDLNGTSKFVHGYGINADQVELMVFNNARKGKLFTPIMGYDVGRLADVLKLVSILQWKWCSPRFHGKLADIDDVAS